MIIDTFEKFYLFTQSPEYTQYCTNALQTLMQNVVHDGCFFSASFLSVKACDGGGSVNWKDSLFTVSKAEAMTIWNRIETDRRSRYCRGAKFIQLEEVITLAEYFPSAYLMRTELAHETSLIYQGVIKDYKASYEDGGNGAITNTNIHNFSKLGALVSVRPRVGKSHSNFVFATVLLLHLPSVKIGMVARDSTAVKETMRKPLKNMFYLFTVGAKNTFTFVQSKKLFQSREVRDSDNGHLWSFLNGSSIFFFGVTDGGRGRECNVLFVDDIAKSTDSPTVMEKNFQSMKDGMFSRGLGGYQIIFLANSRLHIYDPYSQMVEYRSSQEHYKNKIPAINIAEYVANEDMATEDPLQRGVGEVAFGKRDAITCQGLWDARDEDFLTQYQGMPELVATGEGLFFPASLFDRRVSPKASSTYLADMDRIYISSDLAEQTNASADYTCIVVGAIKDGNLVVFDGYIGKIYQYEQLELFERLIAKYKAIAPIQMIFEPASWSVCDALKNRGNEFTALKSKFIKKVDRAKAIKILLTTHRLSFMDYEGLTRQINQIKSYVPDKKSDIVYKDDAVDCLGLMCSVIRGVLPRRQTKKPEMTITRGTYAVNSLDAKISNVLSKWGLSPDSLI